MQHGLQTNQCRPVKRLTERRLNKVADSSIPVSLVFFCLPLLHKFQTHCDGRKEKQFVLSLSEHDCHRTGHQFFRPRQREMKVTAM